MGGNEVALDPAPARVSIAEIELGAGVAAARRPLVPLGGKRRVLRHAEATGVEPGQADHGIDIALAGGLAPFRERAGIVAGIVGPQAVGEIGGRREAGNQENSGGDRRQMEGCPQN